MENITGYLVNIIRNVEIDLNLYEYNHKIKIFNNYDEAYYWAKYEIEKLNEEDNIYYYSYKIYRILNNEIIMDNNKYLLAESN